MKNRFTSTAAIVSMVFVATMWGISFLSTKVLLREMGPMHIAFTRFLIASLLLWGALKRLEPSSRLLRKDWGAMALTGFFGTTLYFILENTGLKFTSASNAVLIIATVPAISMGVEGLIRKQAIPRTTLLGVLISIAGVLTVIGPDSVDLGSSKALGNLMVLGAAFAWVAFNDCARPLLARYGKLGLTTYSTWFGTGFLLPLAIAEGWGNKLTLPSNSAMLNLVFLAVICSALCYFLYMFALSNLKTTTVTSYLNIVPFVGVIGSMLFLKEGISSLQILGGIIIVAGVTTVSMGDALTAKKADKGIAA